MRAVVLTAACAMLALPGVAMASGCKVAKYTDLPVTILGGRALVSGAFDGHPTRFILDSGAFYSTISLATAQEFALPTEYAPAWFRLMGINGDVSVRIAKAKDFSISGVPLPHSEFIVGGTDTGSAGLIGQNLLGIGDVEYDFPHGIVRLMRSENCAHVNLAYWAGTKPVTELALIHPDTDSPWKPDTIATVLVNGVKLRAVFDTGAEQNIMTLAAAKRLGITPDSPGVKPSGMTTGLGRQHVPTWRATFDSLDLGGEAIRKPVLEFGDIKIGHADMLIGIDFFLTHHIYVANALKIMFVTYEGGPMFGLTPHHAVDDRGKPLDLTDTAAAPTDAEGYSRRGAALASNRKLPEAIAAFDKAVSLAPSEARYVYLRALVRMENDQPALAMADLDTALRLAPNDAEARLVRAGLRLRRDDRPGAVEDMAAADRDLPASSEKRLHLAGMYQGVDQYAAAIANYDRWLASHPEDSKRAQALNGRCWARALLNRDLDRALADCNAALRATPKDPAILDSRGLVRLRRGEVTQAIADYDAALAIEPHAAWTLYARSIAARAAGRAAQADADRAAALAIDPHVGERAKRIGLEK